MTGRPPSRESRSDGRPLLVVLRALKLGDYLTAIPALRALRDAFPDHRLVLAAPAGLGPLVRHVGAVDELCDTPGLVPLSPRLRRPALAVDLHGRGPGSQPLLLGLEPDRLVCFRHPCVPGTEDGVEWRPDEHEVRRWCRLLTESGIPADPGRLGFEPPEPGPGTPGGREGPPWAEWAAGATVVHPGAASEARRWPADRFAAVARAEARAGRRVIVTGSRAEAGLAAAVAERAGLGPDSVAAGRTGLLELAAVIGAAGRVVCGDTGVAHLATALGTASVVLFGPVSPELWGPPPGQDRHVALWRGRIGDPHAGTVDPGLVQISVEDVLAALQSLSPYSDRAVSGGPHGSGPLPDPALT